MIIHSFQNWSRLNYLICWNSPKLLSHEIWKNITTFLKCDFIKIELISRKICTLLFSVQWIFDVQHWSQSYHVKNRSKERCHRENGCAELRQQDDHAFLKQKRNCWKWYEFLKRQVWSPSKLQAKLRWWRLSLITAMLMKLYRKFKYIIIFLLRTQQSYGNVIQQSICTQFLIK